MLTFAECLRDWVLPISQLSPLPRPFREAGISTLSSSGLKFLGLWAVCVHLADGKIRALWAHDLTLAAACAAAGRVSVLWPPSIPLPFLAH